MRIPWRVIKSKLVWLRIRFWYLRYSFRKDIREAKQYFKTHKSTANVCFVFSTKNRPEFTKRSLASIGLSGGFDIVWLDASSNNEALSLFANFQSDRFSIVRRIPRLYGGPDVAILTGLNILKNSSYDYVGLIENDVEFSTDWLPTLLSLFAVDAKYAKSAGAASLRNYRVRNLELCGPYSLAWNLGAGMILFSKSGLKAVLHGYGFMRSGALRSFYLKKFGKDIAAQKDPLYPGMFEGNVPLSGDTKFCYNLWKNGLGCVASVPSLAHNMDSDVSGLYY